MKYICLGYMDEKKWHEVTGDQATDLIDEIVAYDDKLRANGHFVGGEKLQSTTTRKRCGAAIARQLSPTGLSSRPKSNWAESSSSKHRTSDARSS